MHKYETAVGAFGVYLQSMNKSEHTVKQYALDAKQFVKMLQKDQKINDVLQEYVDVIKTQYPSANTINRKLASIRHFLSFLQLRAEIETFNLDLLQPVKKEATVLQTLHNEQSQNAINVWLHCYNIAQTDENQWLALRNYTIICVIAELGLKPAEVVRMEWSHINLEKLQLKVFSKKKARVLKLSKSLVEQLQQYQQHTIMYIPSSVAVQKMWLGVGNKQGEAITVKTIERMFQFISRTVDFKVTATNLRYSAIQHELAGDVDENELYKQFGYARKGVLKERQQRMS